MELRVGATYRNREREYEVVAIQGDQMTVRYDDGSTGVLTRSVQRRIVENIARDTRAVEPSRDPAVNRDYFRTIGVLARYASLVEGFAPPESVRGFSETYQQLTGRRLAQEPTFYEHPSGTDKWGIELRIQFPAQYEGQGLEFGSASVRAVSAPNGELRINNNAFIRQLFRLGFTFGTGQDIDRIRARIPAEHRPEFDQGAG